MIASTYRFIAFELGAKNPQDVNKVFNMSLLIHLCIGLLIFILAESFGVYYGMRQLVVEPEKINDAVFILRLSAYATIANVVSVPYQGLLVAKEYFSTTAKIEVLRSFFSCAMQRLHRSLKRHIRPTEAFLPFVFIDCTY